MGTGKLLVAIHMISGGKFNLSYLDLKGLCNVFLSFASGFYSVKIDKT